MKTTFGQILCVVLCTVFLGRVHASTTTTTTTTIHPSPTASRNASSHLHSSPHYNMSSFIHSTSLNTSIHNHTSFIPSTIFHNSTSFIHSTSLNTSIHNHTSSIPSTIFHNSTIMPTNSSITPSPTVNFSMSIDMSSMVHNASHMTYSIVPTHSIYPSNASSAVVPSSSVAPTTPPPKLPKGKFSVKKGNDSCLLFWLSLEFDVKYKNKSGDEITRRVVMSSNASASGRCEDSTSCIDITWDFYSLEACFETTATSESDASTSFHWVTTNMTISVIVANNSAFADYGSNATEIKETLKDHSKLEWLSGYSGHSLNCSMDKFQFGSNISALIENVRLQPFAVEGNDFSKNVDSCNVTPPPSEGPSKKKTNKDNVIAIAVGCSLGGLVLIVLIGYFIGRRRKNAIRYRKL